MTATIASGAGKVVTDEYDYKISQEGTIYNKTYNDIDTIDALSFILFITKIFYLFIIMCIVVIHIQYIICVTSNNGGGIPLNSHVKCNSDGVTISGKDK